MPEVIASDGLPARDNGTWAKEKLSFLDEFGPPALQATKLKHERHFVDLFAGPGLNKDRRTGEEFAGSSIRAIKMRASVDQAIAFTHAAMVHLSPEDHDALRERVRRVVSSGESRVLPGNIRHINRLISYNESATAANADALTRFYGTEDWRRVANRRITDAQSPELRRGLEELYMDRMRSLGWRTVRIVRDVRFRGDHRLYKLIFATNHEAGKNIAGWEGKHHERQRDQLGFDF